MMKFLLHLYNNGYRVKRISAQLLLLSIIILIVVFGCSPTNPEFPSAPVSGSVHFINQTFNTIDVIRFRLSNDDNWGRNVINEITIANNEGIMLLAPGKYDFRFESTSINWMRTYTNIQIIVDQSQTITITD